MGFVEDQLKKENFYLIFERLKKSKLNLEKSQNIN